MRISELIGAWEVSSSSADVWESLMLGPCGSTSLSLCSAQITTPYGAGEIMQTTQSFSTSLLPVMAAFAT